MFKYFTSKTAFAAVLLPLSAFALASQASARDYNYSDKVYTAPAGKLGQFFEGAKTRMTSIMRELPSCDDDRVLSLMSERANWAEAHTWQNGDYVSQVSRTHEHGLLDGTDRYGDERQINRRYCGADVMTSMGKKRYVWYLIEQGQGLASFGWNVNFCMAPKDRWKVDDGSCRAIRTQY